MLSVYLAIIINNQVRKNIQINLQASCKLPFLQAKVFVQLGYDVYTVVFDVLNLSSSLLLNDWTSHNKTQHNIPTFGNWGCTLYTGVSQIHTSTFSVKDFKDKRASLKYPE